MEAADRRLHEVPYSYEADGEIDNGIIDALYLRQGTWTIVEFKTDELQDHDDLDRLLAKEKYREQAERYVAAAESLLGLKPRIVLCLLNFSGSVFVHQPDKHQAL